MRKFLIIFSGLVLVVSLIGITLHNAEADTCVTVKDRVLQYSPAHYLNGVQPIKPGFDPFGYNYQAHLFNGYYSNAYLGRDGFPPYEGDVDAFYQRLLDEEIFPNIEEAKKKFEGYWDESGTSPKWVPGLWYWSGRDVTLNMKWNDTWLSNKDCNEDGKLDRGYACDPELANSSACEGAWDTNHQSGTYTDLETGKECHWTYFVKIIKAQDDATKDRGVW